RKGGVGRAVGDDDERCLAASVLATLLADRITSASVMPTRSGPERRTCPGAGQFLRVSGIAGRR
ncbi:hypothetical protein, partial [Streptomyces sp. NPDC005167]